MSECLPYTCIYIDADFKDFVIAAKQCIVGHHNRHDLIQKLQKLWTTNKNTNQVLPCMCVRTGFDLYLTVCNFPKGSEIIISAINIPDMSQIIKHHGLTIVPLDIDIETAAPKFELIQDLVSSKTKAIILTHIYGKYFDVSPYIKFARENQLLVIEDCAEAFSGFGNLGHPESDLVMFSFGLIKYYTSFGGGVLKIRDDGVYDRMMKLHDSYPQQPETVYLRKLIKYAFIHSILHTPRLTKLVMTVSRRLGYDHKSAVVALMRGFPHDLISRIRYRPPTALLYMMLRRQSVFSSSEFNLSYMKGSYLSENLPEEVTQVGYKAPINNFWLFPIVVDNPDNFVKTLNALGIDAYRGATQLNIIEPENGHAYTKHLSTNVHRYPHEAKYLIDHVVYLPVHRDVPFHALDQISAAVTNCLLLDRSSPSDRLSMAHLKSKL